MYSQAACRFRSFFLTYLSCNASYDLQVSEPSCILDLRRVPPGVGRVGLQALIFPVSINDITFPARVLLD